MITIKDAEAIYAPNSVLVVKCPATLSSDDKYVFYNLSTFKNFIFTIKEVQLAGINPSNLYVGAIYSLVKTNTKTYLHEKTPQENCLVRWENIINLFLSANVILSKQNTTEKRYIQKQLYNYLTNCAYDIIKETPFLHKDQQEQVKMMGYELCNLSCLYQKDSKSEDAFSKAFDKLDELYIKANTKGKVKRRRENFRPLEKT